eukprot:12600100-Heterocapsa_arctica.AAC.1
MEDDRAAHASLQHCKLGSDGRRAEADPGPDQDSEGRARGEVWVRGQARRLRLAMAGPTCW